MYQQKIKLSIGGIFLVVTAGLALVTNLTSLLNPYYTVNVYTVTNFLQIGAVAFLGIVQLAKKRGTLLTIAASCLAGLYVLFLVMNPGLMNVIWLAVMVLLILMTLEQVPALNGLRKLWYIPGILAGLAAIVTVIDTYIFYNSLGVDLITILSTCLGTLLGSLLDVAGFLFTGLWIAQPYSRQPGYQTHYQPQYPPQYQPKYQPQPQYRQPMAPTQPNPAALQELERYQQLLSTGVITQEEYDAVRRRILGL